MRYKMVQLRRAYDVWSAKVQQKMNVIRLNLQRLSDAAAEWWRKVTARWPSVSQLKMILMGMCNNDCIVMTFPLVVCRRLRY